MDLEKIKVICDTISFVLSGGLVYSTYKINKSVQRVKESTTKVLDAFTSYYAPRVTRAEDIEGFMELAKTREKYGI